MPTVLTRKKLTEVEFVEHFTLDTSNPDSEACDELAQVVQKMIFMLHIARMGGPPSSVNLSKFIGATGNKRYEIDFHVLS